MKGCKFLYIVADDNHTALTACYWAADAQAAAKSWGKNGRTNVTVYRARRKALVGGSTFGLDLRTLIASGVAEKAPIRARSDFR